MAQKILPFKLESTSETLTSHSGLAIIAEFAHAIGLVCSIKQHFPAPGSATGYPAIQYIMPLLLMLHGGGRTLEDLRELRVDKGLLNIIKLPCVPSSDAAGDWLRRQGEAEGEHSFSKVHQHLFRQGIRKDDASEHILDLDASLIEACKQEASYTYKHFKGYDPIIAHVNGWIAGWLFREGSASPRSDHMALIKQVTEHMPSDRRITHYRSDSAGYQADPINYCDENNILYAIAAVQDKAVKKAIAAIPDSDWMPYGDGFIAETVHSMEDTYHAFRLVVYRRPEQLELIAENDEQNEKAEQLPKYHTIASNFPSEKSASDILRWYAKRGDESENRIKELKIGFGMERMPCGQEKANSIFFAIGCLAYNLFVRFKQCVLSHSQRCCQVQTLRWQIYQIAGKVVYHSRQYTLKVSLHALGLLSSLRQRCHEIAMHPI
jgi:hypothetical protein